MLSFHTDFPCKAANVSKTLGASVMLVTVDLIHFLVCICSEVQKKFFFFVNLLPLLLAVIINKQLESEDRMSFLLSTGCFADN